MYFSSPLNECCFSQVLELLSQSVSDKKVDDIKTLRSQSISFELLKSPYRTFSQGNLSDGSNDLIIYCLPTSVSEYITFGSEANDVRSAILASSAVVAVYDVKNDAFIGGSCEDIIAALGDDSDKKGDLASASIQALSSLDALAASQFSGSSKRKDIVIVVGSGGREHALACTLAQSPLVGQVICCPGNGGTAVEGGKIVNADGVNGKQDNDTVIALTKRVNASMVVVGPEQPLVDGIVDAMAIECPGVRVFGPSQAGAQLEASKAFTKDFLQEHNIPTAKYRNFTNAEDAIAYVESLDENDRQVVKASGLAAGKGVLIPTNKAETIEAVKEIMSDKAFGNAGDTCVIESFMTGPEASCFALCDGKTAVLMPAAQDHKRALDNDQGLNTGGMGAYAPAPVITPVLQKEIEAMCIKTVQKMAERGTPYVGLLYAGMMITPSGPSIIEFNCRFGDPETQVVLPLLETDLYEVMIACCDGNLGDIDVRFKENLSAATVVCAAQGYPQSYPKGMEIIGLKDTASMKNVKVFHAGTYIDDTGTTRCSGGRVLAVSGMGPSLKEALSSSYNAVKNIDFVGNNGESLMHNRTDIGYQASNKKLRIGVMGSTRGTALLPIMEACASGMLRAEIVAVLSNKSDAVILEKGRNLGINVTTKYIPSKGLTRAQYDAECSAALVGAGAEFVVLVGYMRILSKQFCEFWAGRCINVHPSLLPKHAGGMDLAVHQAAIDAGDKESGCSIHQVTEEVDGGPVIVQKVVKIEPGETAESLKAKVQPLEGPAFVEALQKYTKNVISYADAGVDIDAGNHLVEVIKPACKSTRRPGCDADLGGFGGLFDLAAAGYDSANTILIGATDGVGTKLRIAQITKKHDFVGIDLVAMCVNDLIVAGGEPLFFLDYYATGSLSVEEAAAVVLGIAEGCRQAGCGLIGGETAEMPSMYAPGDYDLAGFSVGAVQRDRVLPSGVGPGDVLLGLSSSGIHSNGFSLVRKLISKENLDYDSPCPWDSSPTIGDSLLTPTKIYVKACLPLLKKGLLNGLAHITGGGLLENLPRSLPKGVVAEITGHPPLPPVFKWMQNASGLDDHEMLRTLNCGIGMVLIVKKDHVAEAKEILMQGGEEVYDLGVLVSGEGEQVIMKNSLI
jgi:phosphoribosylamine--glycine ligase/phosphoribosylglycinamide formyltransferase/phosphoribosylformylglycinamidine cyclo-ligase/phosphoribosylamine--glycine ligase/phosphoribosylformylglycinamidine cyclo-ligase